MSNLERQRIHRFGYYQIHTDWALNKHTVVSSSPHILEPSLQIFFFFCKTRIVISITNKERVNFKACEERINFRSCT